MSSARVLFPCFCPPQVSVERIVSGNGLCDICASSRGTLPPPPATSVRVLTKQHSRVTSTSMPPACAVLYRGYQLVSLALVRSASRAGERENARRLDGRLARGTQSAHKPPPLVKNSAGRWRHCQRISDAASALDVQSSGPHVSRRASDEFLATHKYPERANPAVPTWLKNNPKRWDWVESESRCPRPHSPLRAESILDTIRAACIQLPRGAPPLFYFGLARNKGGGALRLQKQCWKGT